LPGDLHQFLRSTRQGKLQVEVDAPVLRQFSQQLDKAASRLSLAIALAALTIGSAIVVSAHGAMLPKDLGAFGTVGFIGALIGGLWLLVSILRSGRRF
ncbi:MAG: ubiquinone biosynthesis protein UbiB, partial [Zoogloea sp.]|nr:ubiquinone biosynthesis protein UbiB [Zoogloea sp.]